ncbi:UTP:RNA uridylyltransferase 1 isoform X2 [Malania oleifera]|uniref:UTP:RNA uridylyltransferase 1 isoform X2 n=1 Tax=Malania oleifera TaxID=397392 RepID=UPI0025AEACA1|nr:UTP:RNA uridylyltransferase 1 isoform X2 [Malania oleifera]
MASGGGGDLPQQPPPPPPPASATGGEFLLHLLQKSSNHDNRPQTTPKLLPQHYRAAPSRASPQSLTHDPAIAAVGPSMPFPPWPSRGHDLTPPSPPPWPHSFSPPYPPHLLGFSQSPPWSVPTGFPCNEGFDISQSSQLATNQRFTVDNDVLELGFLGLNDTGNSVNGRQRLMFGTFPCEIRSQEGLSNDISVLGANGDGLLPKLDVSKRREMGLGNRSLTGSVRDQPFDSRKNPSLNAFRRGSSGYRQQLGGFHRPGIMTEPRQPRGFPTQPEGVGHWDSWDGKGGLLHNVDKEMHSSVELNRGVVALNNEVEKVRRLSPDNSKMHGDVSAELGLSVQLDQPGPPSGSSLHSVSASDVVESLRDLHGEHVGVGDKPVHRFQDKIKKDGGGGASHEMDDLGERLLDALGLDDGYDDKNDLGQPHNPRDKDVRSDTRGQRPLTQRIRNIRRVMKYRSDIDRLNACFLAIYDSLIPAEEEKAKQKQVLTLLEKLVSKEWPKAQLFLYGSCANSFGVSKSDIDVCLCIEDADINKSEILLKLADILQSENLQNVQALTRARVPIVKLKDPVTGISCDICINNVLAVVNTKLLRDYAQIDVRLRQLAFIVKHWAKSRGVNETYQGTLSSYAV